MIKRLFLVLVLFCTLIFACIAYSAMACPVQQTVSGDLAGKLVTEESCPISLTVKEGSVSPSGIVLVLKNDSDVVCQYGPAFRIERKQDGQWEDMFMEEPLTWNAVLFPLNGHEEKELIVDFTLFGHGDLSKGEYRIVKTDILRGGPQDEIVLACEFTIL